MARKIGIREAAEYTGTSVATIRRRIYDGTLPASRFGSHVIKIDTDDLERAFTPVEIVSLD